MDLRIVYYKNGDRVAEYWNDHPLEDAIEVVRGWVEDGNADRVMITDDADKILFQWPRVLGQA